MLMFATEVQAHSAETERKANEIEEKGRLGIMKQTIQPKTSRSCRLQRPPAGDTEERSQRTNIARV